jgi:2-polyprenyl-3-methyl-5-hydroxy-6-metoxy-1,4-benzoquinol methylase
LIIAIMTRELPMDPVAEFVKADAFLSEQAYAEAAEIYLRVKRREAGFAPLCDYRLASIANALGDPQMAYALYYGAFEAKPDVASVLYGEKHPGKGYVFRGKADEVQADACPLCGNRDAAPKWCYPLSEAVGFNGLINPVRMWMYCEPCHHLFAQSFPEKPFLLNDGPRAPDLDSFFYYSNVFDRIARFTQGGALLEVGVGACECLLAAQEEGYDAFGIDVIERHVSMARERFGLNAETADFVEFQTDKKFDVIIMGDVIEHVSSPVAAMKKACDLLNDDGAIWASTPNFDSAYSLVAGHADPMRRQQYHLNYFSRASFFKLLDTCGLAPVNYHISNRYCGSMEVIAVKKSRMA